MIFFKLCGTSFIFLLFYNLTKKNLLHLLKKLDFYVKKESYLVKFTEKDCRLEKSKIFDEAIRNIDFSKIIVYNVLEVTYKRF